MCYICVITNITLQVHNNVYEIREENLSIWFRKLNKRPSLISAPLLISAPPPKDLRNLEELRYTIRIGSTTTILYFDFHSSIILAELIFSPDWPGIGLWVAFTPDWPGSGLFKQKNKLFNKANFSRANLFQFLFYWCTLLSTSHFQSEVSPIAFTFARVRSEFFPSPPRLQ